MQTQTHIQSSIPHGENTHRERLKATHPPSFRPNLRESTMMHTWHTAPSYQLQQAIALRDAQIRRSMLRQYLAEANPSQSFGFQLRAITSSVLMSMARKIKPCRQHPAMTELWVPETQSAS